MANLIIQENGVARTTPAVNGEEITIQAPCDCSAVEGVQIAGVAYPFYDAAGKPMPMGTGLFTEGSLIRVLIDTVNGRATIINHAITPAAINAVNKAGDTMTGFLNMSVTNDSVAQFIQYDGKTFIRATKEIDHVYCDVRIPTPDNPEQFEYVVDNQHSGLCNTYQILHTGNKPSGLYTGNGSATTRTIEIGGIGNVLAVWEINETFLLVSPAGAMLYHEHSNTLQAFKPNVMKFENGVLTMNNNSFGNHSGVGYYYQLL